MREEAGAGLLAAPALLLVWVVLGASLLWLLWLSFVEASGAFGFGNYRLVMTATNAVMVGTTLRVAAITAGLCLLLGTPLAYALAQAPRAWAAAGLFLVLLPLWTSLLVRTYAWLVLLGRRGLVNTALGGLGLIEEPLRLVNNEFGVLVGMVHVMLPFQVLPAYAAFWALDPALPLAAASAGASPARAFWTVTMPVTLPGHAAGVLLVFVQALGFYITPIVLGGGRVMTASMAIERAVSFYSNWGVASALAALLLAATVVLLLAGRGVLHLARGAA